MSERASVPDFTMSMRGYDRHQVDEYVARLTSELADAHVRAIRAEQQLAAVPPAAPAAPRGPASGPGSFAELGPHVAAVLQRASEEASQLQQESAAYAERVRLAADHDAGRVLDEAEQRHAALTAESDGLLADARARAGELLQRSQRHADQRAEELLVSVQVEASALRADVEQLRSSRELMIAEARDAARRLLAAIGDAPDANDPVGLAPDGATSDGAMSDEAAADEAMADGATEAVSDVTGPVGHYSTTQTIAVDSAAVEALLVPYDDGDHPDAPFQDDERAGSFRGSTRVAP